MQDRDARIEELEGRIEKMDAGPLPASERQELLAKIEFMEGFNSELEERIKKAAKMHRFVGNTSLSPVMWQCALCGDAWPCESFRILRGEG